jgi:hypothetical protein
MKKALLVLAVVLDVGPLAFGDGGQVVFEDPLRGKLGAGWSWLEPGLADTVKNALVRAAPERSGARYAIEVTVEFTSPPSQQYEQAGLTWYQGNKPVFKLVHEFIDGKTYIIPGKKPADSRLVGLRLIVSKDQYVAQYRPGAQGEFQTAASGKLPAGADEKVSLQCYNGPAGAEHWMRFWDFRIVRLPE